jgi:hypothetical protein
MVEHAIRVGSEAAAEGIPALIAEWTRAHPALARHDAGETLAEGTRAVTSPAQPEA